MIYSAQVITILCLILTTAVSILTSVYYEAFENYLLIMFYLKKKLVCTM